MRTSGGCRGREAVVVGEREMRVVRVQTPDYKTVSHDM